MIDRVLLAAVLNDRRPITTFLLRVSDTTPLQREPVVGPQDRRTFVRRRRSTRSLLFEMNML